jgi:hypothetical protein
MARLAAVAMPTQTSQVYHYRRLHGHGGQLPTGLNYDSAKWPWLQQQLLAGKEVGKKMIKSMKK